MGSCEEFVLQIKRGAAQSGGAGVATEVSASALGLGPGDDIDIVLGGPEPSADAGEAIWIPLPDDAGFVHVRDLYFDWQAAEPATFVIERLGDVSPRPVRTDDHVARMLEAAAAEIEHSIAFWSGYQARMLAGLDPNAFTDPGGSAGGVQEIVYSHSGVALAADEALVIEVDPAGRAPVGRPALQPPVVRGARRRRPHHQHQPPHGGARRRRPRPGRGGGHRPGLAELARHRGPRRGAGHAALVAPGAAAGRGGRGGAARRRPRRRAGHARASARSSAACGSPT